LSAATFVVEDRREEDCLSSAISYYIQFAANQSTKPTNMCKSSTLTLSGTNPDKELHSAAAKTELVESGFAKRRLWIEMGMLLLSVCYGTIYFWNPSIPVRPELCGGAMAHDQVCLRPDLIAYKVTTMLAMAVMGIMGAIHWHGNPALHKQDCVTSADRLFRPLVAADCQMVVALCFQFWDLVVSLSIPENRDVIFMIHHILAMITAYCSLEYQMVGYYAIFYGGCSEISSLFLIVIDNKHQMFQTEPEPMFLLVSKVLFFVTFTYYRILGWIYYSVPLWKDCHAVIRSGQAQDLRPGKAWVLRLFQAMNLLLGCLQCYWYFLILQTILSQLGPVSNVEHVSTS
jgi:TLC domain